MIDEQTPAMTTTHPPSTSAALTVLVWLVVAAPLLWGVVQTIKKALALFR